MPSHPTELELRAVERTPKTKKRDIFTLKDGTIINAAGAPHFVILSFQLLITRYAIRTTYAVVGSRQVPFRT